MSFVIATKESHDILYIFDKLSKIGLLEVKMWFYYLFFRLPRLFFTPHFLNIVVWVMTSQSTICFKTCGRPYERAYFL